MQVNLEEKPPKRIRKKTRRLVNKALDAIVPIVVVLFIGLYTYAFAYRVVWQRVTSRAAQIALLTVYGVLIGGTLYEWLLLHLYGPGKITKEYIRSTDDDPFLSDPQGYALWCSECQHVKPNRTHHSSKLGRCVPVMDHYCIWIGAVVGQGNRKFFIVFSILMNLSLIFILVVLLIFQHGPHPDTMPLSILLYILTGLFLMFTVMVSFQHLKLLALNQSTLNGLRFRQHDVFLNFPSAENSSRRVVNVTQKGLRLSDLFSHGTWENCREVMGPVWSWLLPIREPIFEPLVNHHLVERFQKESEVELYGAQEGTENTRNDLTDARSAANSSTVAGDAQKTIA